MTKIKELRTKFNNNPDENGNQLAIDDFDRIYLHLNGSKKRQIGMLKDGKSNKFRNKLVYHKQNMKEKVHVFRKNTSWGLHWGLIESLPDDAYVVIDSDVARYSVQVEVIKNIGDFLWFKTEGFERQIFLPLTNWSKEALS